MARAGPVDGAIGLGLPPGTVKLVAHLGHLAVRPVISGFARIVVPHEGHPKRMRGAFESIDIVQASNLMGWRFVVRSFRQRLRAVGVASGTSSSPTAVLK